MEDRRSRERSQSTLRPESQGRPEPVHYTYRDGREDFFHVGRDPDAGTGEASTGATEVSAGATAESAEVAGTAAGASMSEGHLEAMPEQTTAMPPRREGMSRRAAAPSRREGVSRRAAATPRHEGTRRLAPGAPRENAPREIVLRGLWTGAALSVVTMGTMMGAALMKRGSPWAGLNAMATAVGLGGRRAGDRFDTTVTPAGIAVLTGGLLMWGVGYHAALAAARRPSSLLTGALSGLGGYLVDRLILPDRVMASFRKTMGVLGTTAKYVALGVVSARAAR